MIQLEDALIGKHNIDNASFGNIKIGDDLQDWDIVVVGCECHTIRNENEVKCGTFRPSSSSYKNGYINYRNANLDWKDIKDEYRWTYNNRYTHYILKVYRPKPGKEGSFKTNAPDAEVVEE